MRIAIIALFLFIRSLSGCERQSNSLNIKTDYEISINCQFQSDLESNPTTGYSWQWKNKSSVSIVDTFNFQYIPAKTGLMGSGGIERWTFKGIKSGIDSIKLIYCRPWDSTSTVRTKIIVVRVK